MEVYDDIVTVKTRTGTEEEFRYDGKVVTINAKKGVKVPRYMAELAVNENAIRWDSMTGGVVEAKVYIEDDIDGPHALPSEPLTQQVIAEVKNTDGLGDDSIIIEGKIVKKKAINLKPTRAQLNDAD